MKRSTFITSLGGIAAACALQCFNFYDKVRVVELILQQKTTDTRLVTDASGACIGCVTVASVYRLAPADVREDNDLFPAFQNPSDAYKHAGIEEPKPGYLFQRLSDKPSWVKII